MNTKLKLAGALLGATLITATAGVAAEMKSDKDMSKSEKMMTKDKDVKMTSEEMMKKKKMMKEHAKAADGKHATSKCG